jgi:hypothetical protein
MQVLLVVPVIVARMHEQGLVVPIMQLGGTVTQVAVVVPPVVATAQYWELSEHCVGVAVLFARHSKVAPLPVEPSPPQFAASEDKRKKARNLLDRMMKTFSV